MASARLIPKALYHSRRFLKLPVTAQNLMTFLILNSDNDGIVEAYAVMSMINASDDDLRVLEERGFIYVLNEDWITYILQFQEYNRLDARNFQVSKHRQLLIQVHPELEKKLVIPKKREKIKKIPWDATGIPGEGNLREENLREENISDNIQSIYHQVEYDNIRTDMTMTERDILEDVVAVMLDVYTGTSDTIMIGRDVYTRHQVIDRLKAIDSSCMSYITKSINKKAKSISNPRAYILACLYNAPITIDTAYIADINNDA